MEKSELWRTVPARLTMTDRRALKTLASVTAISFGDPVIVNIGIWKGGSMYCLRAGAPEAQLIGIDVRVLDPRLPEKLNARIIKGSSCKVADSVQAPVHLLFIDGDHHYEAVKCDISAWVPKVPPGGIVVIHDYNPPPESLAKPALYHLADVKRAVDEWQAVEGDNWDVFYEQDSTVAFHRVEELE